MSVLRDRGKIRAEIARLVFDATEFLDLYEGGGKGDNGAVKRRGLLLVTGLDDGKIPFYNLFARGCTNNRLFREKGYVLMTAPDSSLKDESENDWYLIDTSALFARYFRKKSMGPVLG